MRQTKLKTVSAIVLLFLALFLLAVPALAFEARTGDEIVVAAGETVTDDLYAIGRRVVVDGVIEGDLVALGSEVVVNGTITGDLLAGAQTVIINGVVEDDVRASGMALELGPEGRVGDDFLGAGFSLHTQASSTIAGDLIFSGFQALLAGDVEGDATLSANSVRIDGAVAGDVAADVGAETLFMPFAPISFTPDAPALPDVPGGLSFGDDGVIGGSLIYTAPIEGEVPAGSVAGTVDYEQTPGPDQIEPRSAAARLFSLIWGITRRFIGLVIVTLLLAWLAPTRVSRLSEQLKAHPWPSLGWGALTYFLFPLAFMVVAGSVVMLAVMLGLIGLGNLSIWLLLLALAILLPALIFFAFFLTFVTKILVAQWLGEAIFRRLAPNLAENNLWPAMLGLLIIVFFINVPLLGLLVNFVVMLLGTGTLFLLWRAHRRAMTKGEKNAPL